MPTNFDKNYLELEQKKKELENRISFALQAGKFEEAGKYCDDLEQIINQMLKPEFTCELPLAGGVTEFPEVMSYCMPTKCIEISKNRTVWFSGTLPLVVAGNGTKKVSIVISKSSYIVF